MSASDGGGQATPTRKTRAMERRLAYLLSAFGLETVHRDVLRAALRVGRSKHGGRRTNLDARFKDTLRRFETQGWVSRDEKAVRVLAPDNLRHHYLEGGAAPEDIDWERCLAVAAARLEDEGTPQREAEVRAARQQMNLWTD
ncbi:hypothetical protein [Streptomyces sp. MNU103]|uniref:hypothetical protein n=1 Tax=Streptomyces sp. MNU103 TaxID=2560024 RepID=UPI001E5223D1|nr:hypothetical protein [Streptomyces sp. MNU103]